MAQTKPLGIFSYTITLLAGAGGQVTKNLFSDADDDGLKLGGNPEAHKVLANFQMTDFANSGNGGNVLVQANPTIANGRLTALTVLVENDSAGAGDAVTGVLTVAVIGAADITP